MKRKHPFLFSLFVAGGIFVFLAAMLIAVLYLSRKSVGVSFKDQIAFLQLKGVLSDGTPMTELLERYGKNPRVKAIVLNIDSPGGAVAPAQEIYRELVRIRKKKPVVAYLGKVAASGGYYVASGASRIVANPGTITGSIGVVLQLSNVEELFKKIGLRWFVLKSGKYKDVGSPYRPMSEEERKLMEGVLHNIHEQFIQDVASGRNLPVSQVREIADGRILTGQQARKVGLVDELGNFEDALNAAKRLASIEGEVTLVRPQRKRKSLLNYILDELIGTVLEYVGLDRTGVVAVLPQ